MKANLKTTVIVAASITFGAAAVQLLHAASGPPAVIFGEINVKDQSGYEREFLPEARKQIPLAVKIGRGARGRRCNRFEVSPVQACECSPFYAPIGAVSSFPTASKGKSQLCCQQYARAHQNDAERVVGWNFEHGVAYQENPSAVCRRAWGLGRTLGYAIHARDPRQRKHPKRGNAIEFGD